MGRVGVGIPYVPLPVHSEVMDVTCLGAQSYQKRCLQVELPVFWGGHLLLACAKGCGSCKAVSGGGADLEGEGKTH